MVSFGPVLSCMLQKGHVWSCMVLYDPIWPSMVRMALYGQVCFLRLLMFAFAQLMQFLHEFCACFVLKFVVKPAKRPTDPDTEVKMDHGKTITMSNLPN